MTAIKPSYKLRPFEELFLRHPPQQIWFRKFCILSLRTQPLNRAGQHEGLANHSSARHSWYWRHELANCTCSQWVTMPYSQCYHWCRPNDVLGSLDIRGQDKRQDADAAYGVYEKRQDADAAYGVYEKRQDTRAA